MLNRPYLLWAVLALPFVYLIIAYQQQQLYYGEVIHSSGELSVRLFMLALIATPLSLIFPGRAIPRWLLQNRRYLGVASFTYAALHTCVYLDKMGVWQQILSEAALPDYWTGWAALLILSLLALTSNAYSVRLLKGAWKQLHRLAYLAAILFFAHWVLVAFDAGAAIAHLAVLALFESVRLFKEWQDNKLSGP